MRYPTGRLERMPPPSRTFATILMMRTTPISPTARLPPPRSRPLVNALGPQGTQVINSTSHTAQTPRAPFALLPAHTLNSHHTTTDHLITNQPLGTLNKSSSHTGTPAMATPTRDGGSVTIRNGTRCGRFDQASATPRPLTGGMHRGIIPSPPTTSLSNPPLHSTPSDAQRP